MSIGITFTAKSKNPSREISVAKSMCKEGGYFIEEEVVNREHTVLRLEFCPLGEVFLNFHRGQIVCECRTNIAGPGFHAAIVDWLDEFARKCELTFKLDDETDYFTNRRFESLQKDHFNRWLGGVAHVVSHQATNPEIDNLMICWPLDGYRPHNVSGTIVTPMGRYAISEFVKFGESKEGIEQLAAEFFVWNDQEKNARFYRNSALVLLWSDCFFMPSARSDQDYAINARIIDLLNKCSSAPTLPFPKREYLELCNLHGVTAMAVDAFPDYNMFDSIGYRRKAITHIIGNLKIPLPGYFLFEVQEKKTYDHVFYDAIEDNWHELRLSAFLGKKPETDFDLAIFAKSLEEPITLELDGVRCRAAYSGRSRHLVKDKPYYSVIAQAFSDRQINLMTLSFAKESEKDWAFDLLKTLTADSSPEMTNEPPPRRGFLDTVSGFLARIFGR